MELRLIVELDGGQHAEQVAYDQKRDRAGGGGGHRSFVRDSQRLVVGVATGLEV